MSINLYSRPPLPSQPLSSTANTHIRRELSNKFATTNNNNNNLNYHENTFLLPRDNNQINK